MLRKREYQDIMYTPGVNAYAQIVLTNHIPISGLVYFIPSPFVQMFFRIGRKFNVGIQTAIQTFEEKRQKKAKSVRGPNANILFMLSSACLVTNKENVLLASICIIGV